MLLNGSSWTWKSLEKAKKILMDGVVKLVGDGLSIRIWDDLWVLEAPECKPVPRIQGVEGPELIVGQLIKPEARMWDVDKLDSLSDEETTMTIKKIPLWSGGQKDS